MSGAAGAALAEAISSRTPLVVRGGCTRWRAARLWTSEHLRTTEPDAVVDVQVLGSDGELSGAAGAQNVMPMTLGAFIQHPSTSTLYLAQSDLDAELPSLARQAPALPPFGRAVLRGGSRARRHLWLNRGQRVRSRLHYDAYDNVLCCLRGRKTLVLLPPRAAADEHVRPCAPHSLSPNQANPDPAALRASGALELRAGDCVYIPQGWWHEVDSEPETLAISYWWRTRGALALSAELSEELPEDSCPAVFVLREAARAVVRREQRRRLDALAHATLPDGRPPQSPVELAGALWRAHSARGGDDSAPRASGRAPTRMLHGARTQPSSARALVARNARAQCAALVWASCPGALAAALMSLDGGSAPGFAQRWVARLDARSAFALTAKLDESGSCAACGGTCSHSSAPRLGEVLFSPRAEGAQPAALRMRLITQADRYSHRVCARVIPRALGMAPD